MYRYTQIAFNCQWYNTVIRMILIYWSAHLDLTLDLALVRTLDGDDSLLFLYEKLFSRKFSIFQVIHQAVLNAFLYF